MSILIVFIVGLIDDLRVITAFKKLIGQILATLILIFLGDLQIDNMHGVFKDWYENGQLYTERSDPRKPAAANAPGTDAFEA